MLSSDGGTLRRRAIDKRERIEETNRFLADGGTLGGRTSDAPTARPAWRHHDRAA